ncbi:MAG: T9SS type A sorting domain-containing protein [Bacteroidales bacterium]|nr:T9SS type A sorting domain-containing protein [Bacteroidales bacterium]
MKNILLILLLVAGLATAAQQTVTYMQYNLLNYGNFTSYCTSSNNNQDAKDQYLKTILNHIQPDILAVNEVGRNSANATRLLNQVLNSNTYGVAYKRADITNYANSEIINLFFYNQDKLELASQSVAQSILRDINIYTLYAIDEGLKTGDTTFLTCITGHLKAGSGGSDAQVRATMTENLMNYLEWNEISGGILFSGDMNVYSDDETAVTNLVNHPDPLVRFYDPIDKMGDWNNSSYYAGVHTQSTHADYSGCAASGGLDDRFDFIFINKSINDGLHGVEYVEGSYTAVGNDSNHFNKSITDAPTNTSVPAEVLEALYANSDHLPVTLEMEITIESSIHDYQPKYPVLSLVNPVKENLLLTIYADDTYTIDIQLITIQGKQIIQLSKTILPGETRLTATLPPLPEGVYVITSRTSNGKFFSEKIIIQ